MAKKKKHGGRRTPGPGKSLGRPPAGPQRETKAFYLYQSTFVMIDDLLRHLKNERPGERLSASQVVDEVLRPALRRKLQKYGRRRPAKTAN